MSTQMNISRFFDEEFKLFSQYDNVRSIPSIIDGLKDSQRKAVYGMFCHGQSEIKLAQLSGASSLISHYQHGEDSLAGTIAGLAQSFPGSNNMNLFEPIGQFGSILSSEPAAPRYIYTKPSSNLRLLFRKDDDCILEHRYEDGDKAEPVNYFPILPLWIVNGSVGIGTGHSVKILPRDPKAVSDLIKKIVNGVAVRESSLKKALHPHYNGWKGEVKEIGEGKFELHGVIEKINTTTLRVTELPVTYELDKFKQILTDLMDANVVKDYDNNSTENGFDFIIKVSREYGRMPIDKLMTKFKLITRVSENVTMWNTEGKLQRYTSVYEALTEFVQYRLVVMEKRRLTLISDLTEVNDFLSSKLNFIEHWNSIDNAGKLKRSDIEKLMTEVNVNHFDRLFAMNISSLTLDKIDDLKNEIYVNEMEILRLKRDDADSMYIEDLL